MPDGTGPTAAPYRGAALITGASSGIGLELARLFAADRKDLVLVARNRERLTQLAVELQQKHGVSVNVLAADLSEPDAPSSIARALSGIGVAVETLVNNAGIGVYGPFVETDLAKERAMIQINVVAPTELTKMFLPAMMRRGRGQILNVASTAAFQPGPLMAAYYATKAYVLSFSEALANETKGTGVTITTLCPGPTITEFQKRAGANDTVLFNSQLVMEARRVARAGYEGMKKGKSLVIPGLTNRLMVQGLRLLPRKTVTQAARRIQERRK
ncbi:MAG: SDR family NAD(P)-dependent oxidoreductase [Thermoanaerobaculia bacterium]